MSYGWKLHKPLEIAAAATAVVSLGSAHEALEKLTVWALSSEVVQALTFQVTLGGTNFTSPVVFAGPAKIAQPVFQSVAGTVTEGIIIPPGKLAETRTAGVLDTLFPFELRITNGHGAAQRLHIRMAAIAHPA